MLILTFTIFNGAVWLVAAGICLAVIFSMMRAAAHADSLLDAHADSLLDPGADSAPKPALDK